MSRTFASSLALLLAAGCVRDTPAPPFPWCSDPAPVVPDGGPAVTYAADVAPILAARCTGCHTVGAIAPFALTSYALAVANAPAVRAAVLARLMPPWPLAHCAQRYPSDFSLGDGEIATLVAWVDQGTPEGSSPATPPAPAQAPQASALSRVDLTLTLSRPYLPKPAAGKTDELRCFILDWPETESRFVTGFDVRPTAPTEVHHARAYVVDASTALLDTLQDGLDGRPGFPCAGGVFGAKGIIGAWRPGAHGEALPAGLGYRVDPGSKIILGLHFRTGSVPVPDQTSIDLTLESQVAHEARLVYATDPGWEKGGMRIPAGASDVPFAYQTDPTLQSGGKPMKLYAANLHMHEHGVKMLLGLRHADGTTEPLALDPRWNYFWVGEDYFFDQPIDAGAGDQLYVECHFDNSAGRADLNWGNDQEMCVGYVTATW